MTVYSLLLNQSIEIHFLLLLSQLLKLSLLKLGQKKANTIGSSPQNINRHKSDNVVLGKIWQHRVQSHTCRILAAVFRGQFFPVQFVETFILTEKAKQR
jgi:hypothetical protein